jgi:iron(III) transport system substrate-binding protein
LLIGIALAAAACRGPAAGGADKSAAQAAVPKGNRILSVYTALDPNESQIYFKAYQEQTGVVVRWVSMSSGAVFARVLAEKNNPSMGLWFGGPATDFIAATEQGLLAPYKPNIDFDLPDNSHDPNWNWSGLYFGAIGFAANTKRLARLGIKPPESWADLLDPKLKGEIGVAYPYTSGTAFTFLASLIEIMGGEDKAFDYIKRLNENVHHYNKSGSSCVTQVGLGEIAVGIAFSHDILKKGPGRGYPVVLKAPKEGTGFEIGAMALIKNGPDREEAKKFIDWMLSVKGQNMMQEWYRIPLNPKATVGVGAVTADKVKLAKDNIVWAGKNKARLIEHWRTITAQ